MYLVMCSRDGEASGPVGWHDLDIDGCVTVGGLKYRITDKKVETPMGVARIAILTGN
ncbi:hypothetical protein ACIBG7_18665 [Nonomuraea sp. NPDC050328]|uniref:hypothetical protein n=1 Tax=Nonomuraea sp. NPDC050328 TaxID=3364361 RepID=UPI0037A610B8